MLVGCSGFDVVVYHKQTGHIILQWLFFLACQMTNNL